MAQEITISATLQVSKGPLSLSRSASYQPNMAGKNDSCLTQSIPTTAGGTQLTIASGVATLGCCYFKNMDNTNFIDLGVQVGGTFYPLFRLLPGEAMVGRFTPGITPYALANTAAVLLEVTVLEA